MSENLGTGAQILTPKNSSAENHFLKNAIKNYRRNEKTGPALYELISALKEHPISPGKKVSDLKFENKEVQNLLSKLRTTDSEKKKLKGHWESPKESFTYLEPLTPPETTNT